jgi:hypothetical protein
MALATRCTTCGTSVRDMLAHQSTRTHQDRLRPSLSTGPKGSHPYRPPMMHAAPLAQHGAAEDRRYEAEAERIAAILEDDPDALAFELDRFYRDIPPADPVQPRYAGRPVRSYRPGPCARCGKRFRTDNGLAWHVRNVPDCTRWAVAS